jgi:biopolymer transport protein ExbD
MNPTNTQPKGARRTAGILPSFLDVTFVLLFQFLLISTLANTTSREAIERTLPSIQLPGIKSAPPESEGLTKSKSVVVSVREGPEFFLESKKMTVDELSKSLKEMKPPELEIRGDSRVFYGAISQVLEVAQANGIANVALTYRPEATKGQ